MKNELYNIQTQEMYLIKKDLCCVKNGVHHKKQQEQFLYSINWLRGPPRQVQDTGFQALPIENIQKSRKKEKKKKEQKKKRETREKWGKLIELIFF